MAEYADDPIGNPFDTPTPRRRTMQGEHICMDNRTRGHVPGSDFQYEFCKVCNKTRCESDGKPMIWWLSYEKRALICDGDETSTRFEHDPEAPHV